MMLSEQYDVIRKNLGVFQKQKQWILQQHCHFVIMWQVYVYFDESFAQLILKGILLLLCARNDSTSDNELNKWHRIWSSFNSMVFTQFIIFLFVFLALQPHWGLYLPQPSSGL
jgi:hypothetical protein